MQDEDIRRLDLFQAVFDEFPDVIVVKDAEGRFLLCNRTVAGLYGTTPEAMVGKDDGDFGVPRKMAEEFRRNVKGIMAKGAVEVVFEDSRDATTGEIRHFKSVKKPFKDPGGRDQILVIAHDITDVVRAQERVAESERRLREVMAATQEGIWDWHVATGKVIHNSQWYSLLGFEEGEIEGSVAAFSERIHPEDKPSVWAAIQALLEGRVDHYTSEHRLIRKDGSVIWVRDRGRVAERDGQGSPVRVVGAYADVTDKRNDQVALEQALVAAESATQAKSEFLATMSHEIRTPMNGILGMAQLLMSDAVTDAERRQFAQVIIGSGQTLLTLLNDILDFSKVEAGRLDIVCEPFDPQRLVRETVAIFVEQAQSKGLALEVDCRGLRSRLYKGDAIRLRQMLSNLLSNAIKFTERGSIGVELEGRTRPDGAEVLAFSVADTGIGIAAEKQAALFHPFSQADSSTTRKYGGTGLGLSIVRRLAELMDGDISMHSEPGKGSRFGFSVRVECLEANAGPASGKADAVPEEPPSGPLPGGRLLVAEDNPVNRKVMESFLGKLGMSTDFAFDGQAALDYIVAGGDPVLVLMDVQMPGMDGLEAAARIRRWESDNGRPRCPIIALTAGAFEEDRRRCLEAGMDDYLPKPVSLVDLRRMIGKWLGAAGRGAAEAEGRA